MKPCSSLRRTIDFKNFYAKETYTSMFNKKKVYAKLNEI